MCGIAVSLDLAGRGRARPWALPHLRHRGPDSEASFAPGADVAVEHCRLAIIDPDNREADQPLWDSTGEWVIAYNGELFNFRELRRELERDGVRFRTASDTEVVLEAFVRHGEAILPRLTGMFAFAIWNRTTGELFLARDQMGVKPLYYTVADGLLLACSELRPLLAHPSCPRDLDPGGVVEFLAFGHNGDERTLVSGVRKLPPGHFLRAADGSVRIGEYWDVDAGETFSANGRPPARELLGLLEESVAAATVSDVPLSVMLSGGLDSAAVAALMARYTNPAEVTAYSVAFHGEPDEAAVAARLARDLGFRHRTIEIGRGDVLESFDEWLLGLDYPSADPTWIAVWFIARAVREDGIKVILSGDGGDELFGGYTRWMKYLRFHDQVWRRVPRGGRRVAGRVAGRAGGLAGDIAHRAGRGGDLFVPSRPFHDDVLGDVLAGPALDVLRAAPADAFLDGVRDRFASRFPDADYLAWMSYVSTKTYLVEDYLQRLDKMGMQHSVEGRVPLLDPRLATWAFSLPQRLKVDGFEGKALFRSAVGELLPDYIRNRPKMGFCPPVETWAGELLAKRGRDVSGPLFESGLVRTDAWERVRRSGSPHAAWALGTLSAWTNEALAA